MKRALSYIGVATLAALALISCGGGSDPITVGGPLVTSAPATAELTAGTQTSYRLNGGSPLYSASSGNASVVQTDVQGGKLTLTAISNGSTTVSVMDSSGLKIDFAVVVGDPASISLAPSALVVGNCTSRVPFIFSGGVGPYTTITGDNFHVPVSSPLPLGDGRYYFFADVHWPGPVPPGISFTGEQNLTVLDSQSRTAVASITTPVPTDPCPNNPMLTISPETENLRLTQILAFQINGGPVTVASPMVRFADGGIAKVVSATASTVQVQGIGVGTTLMTIQTSDGQMASVVLHVLPQ